jgi:hypothetical protein
MPTIFEETIQDILWAAAEIPAHQQMRKPVVLLTVTNRSGTSDASGDAYMVMSGEPPTMPVILGETEEDLLRENFRVTPLTGKYRPPAMPVIPEESEKDLEWENFHLMPLTGKHRHLQRLVMHCGTLYSQNGGGSNPGRVSNKKDYAIKLVLGLGGNMDLDGDIMFSSGNGVWHALDFFIFSECGP